MLFRGAVSFWAYMPGSCLLLTVQGQEFGQHTVQQRQIFFIQPPDLFQQGGVLGAVCAKEHVIGRQTQHPADFRQHFYGNARAAPCHLRQLTNAHIQQFCKFFPGVAHVFPSFSDAHIHIPSPQPTVCPVLMPQNIKQYCIKNILY